MPGCQNRDTFRNVRFRAKSGYCAAARVTILLRCVGPLAAWKFQKGYRPPISKKPLKRASRGITSARKSWSEWQDLNLRPLVPNVVRCQLGKTR